MDKNGFVLLVMGFTGKKAHQFKLEYIRAFDKAIETIQDQQIQLAENASHWRQLAEERMDTINRIGPKYHYGYKDKINLRRSSYYTTPSNWTQRKESPILLADGTMLYQPMLFSSMNVYQLNA